MWSIDFNKVTKLIQREKEREVRRRREGRGGKGREERMTRE
jgi:hypothetical protein